MGARYPTAKSQAPRSPVPANFPRPAPEMPFRPPANDNWPRPANDNRPVRSPGRAAARAASRAARFSRAGALGMAIGIGYEYYRWYEGQAAQDWTVQPNNSGHGWQQCAEASATKNCSNGYAGYTRTSSVSSPICASAVLATCSSAGQSGAGLLTGTISYGNLHRRLVFYFNHPTTPGNVRSVEWWERTATGTSGSFSQVQAQPEKPPIHLPVEIPPVNPMWDPFQMPAGQPTPMPAPMPYRILPGIRPHPHRHPNEQPRRGPEVAPRPRVRPKPDSVWVPATEPGAGPTLMIDPTASAGGSAGRPRGRSRSRPGAKRGPRWAPQHKRKRPGPREREGKANGRSPAGNAFMNAVNGTTEALDLLNAMWDGLPPWMKTMNRGQATTPQQKATDLYNAFGRDDFNFGKWLGDAAENAFWNAVGDAVAGAQGVAMGRAARNNPVYGGSRGRGFGAGPGLPSGTPGGTANPFPSWDGSDPWWSGNSTSLNRAPRYGG